MISGRMTKSVCVLAFIVVSTQGYGRNQTTRSTPSPFGTLAPTGVCNGTIKWVADGVCDDVNNNKDCGEETKRVSDSGMRTLKRLPAS